MVSCLDRHISFHQVKELINQKSTDPIYHQGSNPTGPIERSVQIPKLAGETNDGIRTTIHRRLKIPSDLAVLDRQPFN